MKRLLAVAMIVGLAGTASARPPILVPVDGQKSVALQAPQYSPQPTPAPGYAPTPSQQQVLPQELPSAPIGTYVVPGQMPSQGMTVQPGMILSDTSAIPGIPLYTNVKVRQPRNIAACAVPKIVCLPDPCDPCKVVCIQICVPPCACENVYFNPKKDRVTFDYGKYAVNITARRGGLLVVNYDD